VKKRVSNALISQVDLFASFANLLDAKEDGNAAPDSKNLLPVLLGKDKNGREYVIEQAGALSITTGEWKYIEPSNRNTYDKYTNTELGNSKEPQLYKIKKDRAEKTNLAAQHPDKVETLGKLLNAEKVKR